MNYRKNLYTNLNIFLWQSSLCLHPPSIWLISICHKSTLRPDIKWSLGICGWCLSGKLCQVNVEWTNNHNLSSWHPMNLFPWLTQNNKGCFWFLSCCPVEEGTHLCHQFYGPFTLRFTTLFWWRRFTSAAIIKLILVELPGPATWGDKITDRPSL